MAISSDSEESIGQLTIDQPKLEKQKLEHNINGF